MERQHKILIIDDTAMFRELGSIFLARFGVVITASSGEEGLALARRNRPDVIVTDLHMPGMAGDAVCEQIRLDPDLCDTPVVLILGGENPRDRARAVRAGADDIVAKPISRIDLVDAVNRYLRSPRKPGLTRVDLETKVCIRESGAEAWGRSTNLSRGGIFVKADRFIPVETEVELEFLLPEAPAPLSSTARVVWGEKDASGATAGLGLQFLALDRESSRQIESFVFERASEPSRPELPPPSRGS